MLLGGTCGFWVRERECREFREGSGEDGEDVVLAALGIERQEVRGGKILALGPHQLVEPAGVDLASMRAVAESVIAPRKRAVELLGGALPPRPPGFCTGCPERPEVQFIVDRIDVGRVRRCKRCSAAATAGMTR